MKSGSVTGTSKSKKRCEPLDLERINRIVRRETLIEVPENEED